MVAAPACSAQPKDEITPPMKTDFLRPKLSASHDTDSAPMIAPPVKDETMPPVSEALGLPKYSMKVSWPMVEVITPLS